MSRWHYLALSLVLAAASPVLAVEQRPGGPSGVNRSTPQAGSHAMPPRGFHNAPPGFHGPLPQGHRAPSHPYVNLSHRGTFRGRSFNQFTSVERRAWQGGAWRHEQHDGHLGWWWVVGGTWFFYPQPIYPYPLYVGPNVYYDYYDVYGTPSYYWYWCDDPPGYYPYVKRCFGTWHAVPPATDIP